MAGLNNIIGYESVKEKLRQIADLLKNYSKYEKLGVKFPRGIMLDGEPGVGKTLMAMSLIEESEIKNVKIIRKDVEGKKLINEIKLAFDYALDHQPAIILFDDLDKFENDDERHKDGESYVAVQAGIDRVKNDKIFVIATINDWYKIPDSLKRSGRLGERLKINKPRKNDIEPIIKHYLSNCKFLGDIDYKELANIFYGFSCADLEEVVNKASALAVYKRKEIIDMDELIAASLELNFGGVSAFKDASNTDSKEDVAYHEAGHVVVAEVLSSKSVSLVSIDQFESETSGLTFKIINEGDKTNIIKEENKIKEMLGGAVAYYLKYNKCDLGASRDYEEAYDLLKYLQKYNGYHGVYKIVPFGTELSNEGRYEMEKQISFDMNKYYEETMRIISNNMEFLEKLANALIERKTLRQKDIQEIKSTCNIVL